MNTRQDMDDIVQALQRLHSSLPPNQQGILEWTLDSARWNWNSQGDSSGPDVTGYMARAQEGWSNDQWQKYGEWAWSRWRQQQT